MQRSIETEADKISALYIYIYMYIKAKAFDFRPKQGFPSPSRIGIYLFSGPILLLGFETKLTS
jgi:hypothetical protein